MKFYDRTTTVTVNGTDYSDEFNGLSVGFESYVAATGMIKKTGTLNLCEVRNSAKTLDPRVNRDFFPGAIVLITWNSSPHPLAGEMLLMAPPTATAIDNSLPVVPGNIAVTLELGCNLAYYDINQPDSDETEITPGDGGIASLELVEDLLLVGGIPGAEIGVGLTLNQPVESRSGDIYSYSQLTTTLFNRSIAFPITKEGGSFVSVAAELLYSGMGLIVEPTADPGDPPVADSSVPLPPVSFLYCDSGNVVKNSIIKTDGYVAFTRDLGLDDISYEPQLDGQVLPGLLRLSAPFRSVSETVTEPSVEVETDANDRIVSRKTTETETFVFDSEEEGFGGGTNIFPNPYWLGAGIFPSSSGKSWIKKTITIQKPEYLIIDGSESRSLSLAEETIEISLFENNKRIAFVRAVIVPLVAIVPGIFESDNTTSSLSTTILNGLDVCSEITVISYEAERTGGSVSPSLETPDPGYDSFVKTTVYNTRGFLNPGRSMNPDNISEIYEHVLLQIGLEKKEKWVPATSQLLSFSPVASRPRSFSYSLSQLVPKIVADPTFNSGSEDDCYFLVSSNGSSRSGAEVLPPNSVYFDDSVYVQEDLFKTSVVVGDGDNPRENSISVPFGFSVRGLETLGEIEAKIIAGRQYQYLIQIGWEGWPSQYGIPMVPIVIREPSRAFPFVTTKTYPLRSQKFLADALSWNHQPNGIVSVGFAGIFLGTIGTTNVLIPESSYGDVVTFNLPGSLNTVVVEIDLPIEVGWYITIVDETTGTNYYFLVTNVSGLNITLRDITPDTDIAGTEISGVPDVSATLPSGYAPDDDGILQPFTIVPVTSQVTVPIGGELVRAAILYSVSYDGFIY